MVETQTTSISSALYQSETQAGRTLSSDDDDDGGDESIDVVSAPFPSTTGNAMSRAIPASSNKRLGTSSDEVDDMAARANGFGSVAANKHGKDLEYDILASPSKKIKREGRHSQSSDDPVPPISPPDSFGLSNGANLSSPADHKLIDTTRSLESLSTRTPSDPSNKSVRRGAISPVVEILARRIPSSGSKVNMDKTVETVDITDMDTSIDSVNTSIEFMRAADKTLDDITGEDDALLGPPSRSSHVTAPDGTVLEVYTREKHPRRKPLSANGTNRKGTSGQTSINSDDMNSVPNESESIEASTSAKKRAKNGKMVKAEARIKNAKTTADSHSDISICSTTSDWAVRPKRSAATKTAAPAVSKAGAVKARSAYKEVTSDSEDEAEDDNVGESDTVAIANLRSPTSSEPAESESEGSEFEAGDSAGVSTIKQNRKVKKTAASRKKPSSSRDEKAANGRAKNGKGSGPVRRSVSVKEINKQVGESKADHPDVSDASVGLQSSPLSKASAKKGRPSSKASPTKAVKTQEKTYSSAPISAASSGSGVASHNLAKPPLSTSNDNSDIGEDDVLRSLPSSSLAAISSQPPIWDLSLLDESIFVTLPSKRRAEELGSEKTGDVDAQAEVPRFWWPARIINRNRQNFRVKLVQDLPKKEILSYSEAEIVLPQMSLNETSLVSFADSMSEEVRFPTAAAASSEFLSHPDRLAYVIPTESAFKHAIRQSSKVNKEDALPEIGGATFMSPPKKAIQGSPKRATAKAKGKQREESEEVEDVVEGDDSFNHLIDSLKGPQTQVNNDSDSEELDPDLTIGMTGLGQHRTEWWPARIIEILEVPRSKLSTNSSGRVKRSRPKTGPYRVEMFPSGEARLWRDQMVFIDDADFVDVRLGTTEAKGKDQEITPAQLHDIMPEMRTMMNGLYEPCSTRHNLFFQSREARDKILPALINYGEFSDLHIKQLGDFLQRWLDGQELEYVQPDAPANIKELSDEARMSYISAVLVPTALELLVIADDDTYTNEAKLQLEQQQRAVDSNSIRIKAHELAAQMLKDATDWHERVYIARQLQESAAALKKEYKPKTPAKHKATGRKRRINYAE